MYDHIVVYTDGSCDNNGSRIGGWCAVILALSSDAVDEKAIAEEIKMAYRAGGPSGTRIKGQEYVARILYGTDPRSTNNRMEMRAIIEALKSFIRPCSLEIVSDSLVIIGLFDGSFKPKENLDLIAMWLSVSSGFAVTFRHIRGHRGDPLNCLCDYVCGHERLKLEPKSEPDKTLSAGKRITNTGS